MILVLTVMGLSEYTSVASELCHVQQPRRLPGTQVTVGFASHAPGPGDAHRRD